MGEEAAEDVAAEEDSDVWECKLCVGLKDCFWEMVFAHIVADNRKSAVGEAAAEAGKYNRKQDARAYSQSPGYSDFPLAGVSTVVGQIGRLELHLAVDMTGS